MCEPNVLLEAQLFAFFGVLNKRGFTQTPKNESTIGIKEQISINWLDRKIREPIQTVQNPWSVIDKHQITIILATTPTRRPATASDRETNLKLMPPQPDRKK